MHNGRKFEKEPKNNTTSDNLATDENCDWKQCLISAKAKRYV